MRFDGVERDVELVADLSLREVGPEQPEHGELSITELNGVRQLGPWPSIKAQFTLSIHNLPGKNARIDTGLEHFLRFSNNSVQP